MIDPKNFLSYSVWLSLPSETRYKIADLYGLKATGIREVVDSRVVSDGFLHASLAVITKESMREKTGLKSDDFYILFNALVESVNKKAEPEIKQQDVQQEEPEKAVSGTVAPRAKRGRKAKGTK